LSKVRKIHRYLSIFIAIQLIALDGISGIYFAFNKIEMVRGESNIENPLRPNTEFLRDWDNEIIRNKREWH
jgi:hypothetical protein